MGRSILKSSSVTHQKTRCTHQKARCMVRATSGTLNGLPRCKHFRSKCQVGTATVQLSPLLANFIKPLCRVHLKSVRTSLVHSPKLFFSRFSESALAQPWGTLSSLHCHEQFNLRSNAVVALHRSVHTYGVIRCISSYNFVSLETFSIHLHVVYLRLNISFWQVYKLPE